MENASETTPAAAAARWPIAAFAATVLLGAFLLFQVQPVASKAILPWFGGCPAVWTTCMLFFQTLLFGGYLYAHLLQRWLRPRQRAEALSWSNREPIRKSSHSRQRAPVSFPYWPRGPR